MYAKIIDDLIEQAAVSFEEDGVNHSVLDELKKVGHFVHFSLRLSYIALLFTRCQYYSISRLVILEDAFQ